MGGGREGERGRHAKFTNECSQRLGNPSAALWHGKQIIVDFVARIVSKMFQNTDDNNNNNNDNKRGRWQNSKCWQLDIFYYNFPATGNCCKCRRTYRHTKVSLHSCIYLSLSVSVHAYLSHSTCPAHECLQLVCARLCIDLFINLINKFYLNSCQ